MSNTPPVGLFPVTRKRGGNSSAVLALLCTQLAIIVFIILVTRDDHGPTEVTFIHDTTSTSSRHFNADCFVGTTPIYSTITYVERDVNNESVRLFLFFSYGTYLGRAAESFWDASRRRLGCETADCANFVGQIPTNRFLYVQVTCECACGGVSNVSGSDETCRVQLLSIYLRICFTLSLSLSIRPNLSQASTFTHNHTHRSLENRTPAHTISFSPF